MSREGEIQFWLDRAKFFEIGRVLQRNWRVSALGPGSLTVQKGKLTIMSKRGGGEIICEGQGEVSVEITASEFRKLITAKGPEGPLSGQMKLTFRPRFGEVAIDVAGVKARFL